eukprot:767554-Amphidinium_carterae.1
MLDPGRISAGSPPVISPGTNAYAATLEQTRKLLGENMSGAALPGGAPPVGQSVHPGRARATDSAIRAAIAQGGETAQMAIQLSMIEL